MSTERETPRPQTPACDRCTVGVMDAMNPHLWGHCDCECHDPVEQTEPSYEHMAMPRLARRIHAEHVRREYAWQGNCRCDICRPDLRG